MQLPCQIGINRRILDTAMTTTTEATPRSFEADVAKLLHLMVHSVYSDKDVFLRELISNTRSHDG
jgi:hypothetical protein